MSKARDLADVVAAGGQLADGVISVSEISDLTATAAELNTLDGITANVTELNTLDGATSSIQDQIDNISVTSGSLTKTFANGEQASITLSSAISPAPVVSVTKEVSQVGVSSKGTWDVATDGANYELHDTAYATTLTPGQIGFQDASTWSYDSKSFDLTSQDATPSGIAFNSNGTKMYVIGYTSDEIHQYSLSTAFDVSTASYDSVSLDVSSQDTVPTGLTFNNDGTKIYVTGAVTDAVYQYSLSTAFDLSTASYDSVSLDVSSQEASPGGLKFNSDGTKMYIVGWDGDDVNQYSLSTAFDLSTASFDSVTFSVSSQETFPTGIAFNSDGTKMYVIGSTGDDVNQYSLSTAFDLSTASFDSVTFDVSSQEDNPRDLVFSNDGTKMFIVGTTNGIVYQYSTSKDGLVLGSGSFASTDVGKRIVGNGGEAILTATDGSYSVVTAFTDSSTIASGSWSMFALTFDGTDGVKIGGLINGFNIANASYDSVSFSTAGQEGTPEALAFNNDGTKMYLLGSGGDDVNQYTLSTAFDISTASFDSVTFSVASQDTSPADIAFNTDGTKMFILGNTGDDVNEYALSTAFDISTASFTTNFSVTSQEANPYGMTFNNDGTKMYIIGIGGDDVNQYSLSTAFDISTASFDSVTLDVSSEETSPRSVVLSNDGLNLFIIGASNTVFKYTLSTAYDVSTGSYSSVSFSVASEDTTPRDVSFNNDGTKMYIVGDANNEIFQYTTGETFVPTSQYHPTVTKASGQIDTAFWTDINTMTADETLNGGQVYYAVSTDDRTTWAVIDDTDGVRNIVRDNAGTWQYNTATSSTPYALSSASYDSKSLDVSAEEGSPSSIRFNSDGTKMFILGYTGDEVNEYSLSTAYDITTASAVTTFSVASQELVPRSFVFNPSGTIMLVVGSTNDAIYEYTLTTGYDISTASYSSTSFSVSSQLTVPEGLEFNNNGTKLYVSGNSFIFEYDLSTAYDISTAAYNSVSLNTGSQTTTPDDLRFNSDGTKLFVCSDTNFVYQYGLTTAYDLSTASYDSVSFDVSNEVTDTKGFGFNGDGTKMYITDPGTDAIYQYSVEAISYTTSETWANATTNDELYALQEALTEVSINRMNSTQLNAVTDPNHYTLGDTLDLAIMLYTASAGSIPESDGVTINYDAEALNQGAVVGTDYDFDFPDSTTVRVTSNAAQNLKIRVV